MRASFLSAAAVNMDVKDSQSDGPETWDILLEGVPVTVEVLSLDQFNALPASNQDLYGVSCSGRFFMRVIPAGDRPI